MIRKLFVALAILAAAPAAAQAPAYHSSIEEFDRFVTETATMPPAERVAALRNKFNALVPGFYMPRGGATEAQYEAYVRKHLEAYPAQRDKVLTAARDFTAAYQSGNARFLRFFPDYAPTMPIYLLHSLGEMDGGTREIGGRTVAAFGADVIAQVHDAGTIGAFLDHELFHFHHARYFKECDQVWCSLWAEGLATYVAGQMNPGADDRTLMLATPRPIRPDVDARLDAAMCFTRARLFSKETADYGALFFMNGKSPFPPRFGYYVGYLLATRIAEGKSLAQLARLSHDEVRPLLEKALAGYDCPPAP